MWTDDWIGIPYQELGRGPDSYDCLGLFISLQRVRNERVIFDPLCLASVAARRKLAVAAKSDWTPLREAREGDALLFEVRGMPLHVGYALDGRLMLHTSQDTCESLIEDYRAQAWGDRLEGVYSYAA
jgi:probable lipoprotein NlpC